MRISDKMTYDQSRGGLNKTRGDLSELHNHAASMKKITKPSDDAIGTTRVLAARIDRAVNDQYTKNLNLARSFLESSEQAVGELNNVLVRVKELALNQANDGSANASTRRIAATELDQLYSQVVNIGNRKLGERFLFGGFRTTQAPFDIKGVYQGNDGTIQIEINKGVFVPINLPGSYIYMGKDFVGSSALGGNTTKVVPPEEMIEVRGPANEKATPDQVPEHMDGPNGINMFQVLKKLHAALMANDKLGIQQSLNDVDQCIEQAIVGRSQIGTRLMNLETAVESIQRSNVNAKTLESQVEDADAYELFSDISKAENTLQSTLSTSSKVIQPSLLDFLR